MTNNPEPSAAEKAYGLLWASRSTDPLVYEARKLLLAEICEAGQRRGVEYVKINGGIRPRARR